MKFFTLLFVFLFSLQSFGQCDDIDLGPDINACQGVTIILDATCDNAISYEWRRNAIIIPGETTGTLNITIGGNYLVNIISPSGQTIRFTTVIFNTNPTPNNPTPLISCDEDNDGFTTFNLFDKVNEIVGGEPNISVSFYETFFDASNDINRILNVSSYLNTTANMATVWARAERQDATSCFAIVSLDLVVVETPTAIIPNDLIVEEENTDGFAEFDLTLANSQITGGNPEY